MTYLNSKPSDPGHGEEFLQRSPGPSRKWLFEVMRRMLRIRAFEETVSRLRPQCIPGSVHNSIGQEAEIVGACMSLREDDYMTGNHRSHGHPIGKGVPLKPLMAELLGKKTGVCRGKGGSMHLAAFGAGSLGESGIVGGSIPTAVGAALSAQLRKTDQVCLSFFGDGAANCGPFHESLNLAAIWKLPVVFLCENNGYAMSSAQSRMMAVADVATRAVSYGMPGVVVDGQDVLDVHDGVFAAVMRARNGEGPTLVEAKTYRYCDHQELDFPLPKYRSEEEIEAWRARDPIDLYARHLTRARVFSLSEFELLRSQVKAEVDAAVIYAQESAPPGPEALMQDLFV